MLTELQLPHSFGEEVGRTGQDGELGVRQDVRHRYSPEHKSNVVALLTCQHKPQQLFECQVNEVAELAEDLNIN